jgi:NADPH:quinone reductase
MPGSALQRGRVENSVRREHFVSVWIKKASRSGMFSGRAWRLTKFGDPREAIELQEMSWAEPGTGRVLIRVRTAGAGFPDILMAAGHYPLLGDPPFGLGQEAAGDVVAVPTGSRFSIGDQVTGITAFLQGWGRVRRVRLRRGGFDDPHPFWDDGRASGRFPDWLPYRVCGPG